MQHDLLLPAELRIPEWLDGQPDCNVDRDSEYSPEQRDRARFEYIPFGCDPSSECVGVRVLIADALRYSEALYSCRVEIGAEAVSGRYPIRAANLFIDGSGLTLQPVLVDGTLVVLDGSPEPRATVTPGSGWPDLPALPAEPYRGEDLTIRGGHSQGLAGDQVGLGFFVDGYAPEPLRGLFEVEIQAGADLAIAVDEQGRPQCGSGQEHVAQQEYALLPEGCTGAGCTGLRATVEVESPFEAGSYGDPPTWLASPGDVLFECRFDIGPSAPESTQHVTVFSASKDGNPLAAEEGLVDVFVPEPNSTPTPTGASALTGTPTPTARPTATFVLTPRPCLPRDDGIPVLCLQDLEAEPGQLAELVLRYRSSGAPIAGVQFVAEPGEVVTIDTEEGAPHQPRCRVNPDIDKEASAFAATGGNIKGVILSFSNLDALPDDVVLATCDVRVAGNALPGAYALGLTETYASDGAGNPIDLEGRGAILRVHGDAPADPTPTATATPASRPPTPNPTAERKSEAGGRAAAGQSGCQISAGAGDHLVPPLLLLLPAVVAILGRARRIRRRFGRTLRSISSGLSRKG